MTKIGLCVGRHNMPVDVYVYPENVNPIDVDWLESEAFEFMSMIDDDAIELFVSGLTVAVIAVINACRLLNKRLIIRHYDKVKGEYYAQRIRG